MGEINLTYRYWDADGEIHLFHLSTVKALCGVALPKSSEVPASQALSMNICRACKRRSRRLGR